MSKHIKIINGQNPGYDNYFDFIKNIEKPIEQLLGELGVTNYKKSLLTNCLSRIIRDHNNNTKPPESKNK